MIDPPFPSASMRAPASRQPYQVPRRLTRTVCSKASSGMRSGTIPASAATPALLIMMSMRPKRSMARATRRATCAGSPTSHATDSAAPPAFVMAWRSSSILSAERAARTRLAPPSASTRAKKAPRPYEAPVTIAVLPRTLNSCARSVMSFSRMPAFAECKAPRCGGAL